MGGRMVDINVNADIYLLCQFYDIDRRRRVPLGNVSLNGPSIVYMNVNVNVPLVGCSVNIERAIKHTAV